MSHAPRISIVSICKNKRVIIFYQRVGLMRYNTLLNHIANIVNAILHAKQQERITTNDHPDFSGTY